MTAELTATSHRAELVGGLVDRLRTLLLALDRRDRLETAGRFVGWLDGERREGRLGDHAEELLRRALGLASDPVNFELLALLEPDRPVELARLMEETGLARVAASERVHDLVQAGLASRELIDDQVRGTPLGHGLVAFVRGVAGEAGELLTAELDDREKGR